MAFLSILIQHGGPGAIAGQRLSGTDDLRAIREFYGHRELLGFWWQGGVSFIGLAFFALGFRAYLRTFELGPVAALLADLATAVALLEAPLIAVDLGLQSALVQVVGSGSPEGALALFASWDWIYNEMTYWFEATWMLLWAALALRTGALPAWIGVAGVAASIGLLFNSAALMLRVPDIYTLVPTAILVVWMAATVVYLVRGGRR
ncbi:MAG: DUF4386 family protein [Chloroflexota bacterium]